VGEKGKNKSSPIVKSHRVSKTLKYKRGDLLECPPTRRNMKMRKWKMLGKHVMPLV